MIGRYFRFSGFRPINRRALTLRRLAKVLGDERKGKPFWLECFEFQCRRAVVLSSKEFGLGGFAAKREWPPNTGKVTYQRTAPA